MQVFIGRLEGLVKCYIPMQLIYALHAETAAQQTDPWHDHDEHITPHSSSPMYVYLRSWHCATACVHASAHTYTAIEAHSNLFGQAHCP